MRFLVVAAAASLVSISLSAAQQTPPLTAEQKRAPCAQLVTAAEIKSLGRKDVLAQVSQDHAGSSICGWQTSAVSGFIVTRQMAEWFKYEQTTGPKQSFDERRQAYDKVVGTEPVPGLGLEARITKHEVLPTVMVRRAADTIYVMCGDCTREKLIAIAKLAAN